MTTFGVVSPSSSSSMASASTVSPASLHNLTNHVILSPNREDVSLTLSSSSSFLTNYSSVCSSTSKSSVPSNFATSPFTFNSDTKENSSCPVNNTSMSHSTEHTVGATAIESKSEEEEDESCKLQSITSEIELADPFEATGEELQPNEDSTSKAISSAEIDDSLSNSTQSSDTTSSSVRKKRRRGEGQILIEDLSAIDKSLADGITSQLKPSSTTQAPSEDNIEPTETSSQTGEPETKKSKEDSPAFHLRPRRSHKSSDYCSSGSSSPIFFSPVKRSKQPLLKKSISTYTSQLLTDTSRQLSQIINDSNNSQSGHKESHSILIKEEDMSAQPVEVKKKPKRSFADSIRRDVKVAVYAGLITPLKLTHSSVYTDKYLAMKMVQIKPLRHVQIIRPDTNEKIWSPMLELITVDINDRFLLKHTKGVFDDPSLTQASTQLMTIFLLGTYATRALEMAVQDEVINIVQFRTTKLVQSTEPPKQPPKKRKVVASTSKKTDPSESDSPLAYSLHIIVDSLGDLTTITVDKPEEVMQEEVVDNQESGCSFESLYHDSPRIEEAAESNWAPMVSFSATWQAPEDPTELNKTLYIVQPCIPKFESASRTVKM